MKRNRNFPYLVLALLCVWTPLFMGAWDKDKPSSSTSLRNSNPELLSNQSAVETSFGAHHEFSTGGSNTGDNLRIKFNAPISTPTNAANKSFVYSKDVSAVVEMHWLDESGNELQMTSGGDLYSSAGLTVTNASTFNGNITLGAGDDLIGSATSDITFNTNKFTVAGATGNTVVAGTLDVTGVATIGDGSLLATSAAPSTDAMVANKKYVDDNGTRQVVSTRDVTVTTTTNTITLDDTIPQNTEGTELFTLAITPESATSTLVIEGVVLIGTGTTNRVCILGLFQDSTANALAVFTQDVTLVGGTNSIPYSYTMPSGTTSATTFKLRFGISAAGTLYYNRTSGVANLFGGTEGSTMIITEIGI